MADDTKDGRSGTPSVDLRDSAAVKRPYATLDLKATEIKITPLEIKTGQAKTMPPISSSSTSASSQSTAAEKTPTPAPASSYASASYTSAAKTTSTVSNATGGTATAAAPSAAKPASTAPVSATSPAKAKPETVIVQKRGGFFSHLAAGIIGGVLALAGSEWALPQLGIQGNTSRLPDDTAAIAQRLLALEKQPASSEAPKALAAFEDRLTALEKTAQKIPALAEGQSRLIAETKAALAASASDAGVPEQLTRLASVEDKLKALADAGATDPNAGRLAQLAALTGKVADLETSLATQLTALRKGVSDDVDARIASVTASTEAAKSGTQRIDKDVAGVKSEAVLLTEEMKALKTDNDRLGATLKMAQDETTALKTQVEILRASSAKPTDVAAAVKPVGEKLSSLEQSVQGLMKAEDEHKASSERVLLSLELQNLKRALDGGQKYSAELAAVQKASGGKFDLAALDKFKDAGVPVQSELSRDFRSVASAAIDAEAEPVEGSVVDRLIAGAKSVVRVRKVEHAADDKSAEAVVGRMEVALKESRLTDVIGEAKQLPPKALAVAQPFVDRVAARVSVDTAVGTIETQLKSSLGGAAVPALPPPSPEPAPKAAP